MERSTESPSAEKEWIQTIVVFLFFTLVGLIAVFNQSSELVGWVLLGITLSFFFLPLTVLPHELGHVGAAYILGIHIFNVQIGFGPTIWEKKWGETRWTFKLIPFYGHVAACSEKIKYFRIKIFLSFLAGPLTNLFLIILAYLYICRNNSMIFFVGVFIVANAINLIASLWPKKEFLSFGEWKSDGYFLFTLPFINQSDLKNIRASFYSMHAYEAWRAEDNNAAEGWCEEGLKKYPDHPIINMVLALVLSGARQYDKALQILSSLKNAPDLNSLSKKWVLNDIAFCWMAKAYNATQNKDYQSAKNCFVKGLELYPDNLELKLELKLGLAGTLINLKKYDESRALFRDILQNMNLNNHAKNTVLNNIASVDLLLDRADLLTEADQFSDQASKNEPQNKYFTGTHGCVLIELGQINEGMVLLKKVYELLTSPEDQAFGLCYMALGEKRRGEKMQGMQYLAEARTKDADCLLLEKTERELHSTFET